MPPFRHLSRRDAFLVFLGAGAMHVFLSLFSSPLNSIIINTHHTTQHNREQAIDDTATDTKSSPGMDPVPPPVFVDLTPSFAPIFQETAVLSHAPGWTVFRDLYMSNGTLYVVSSEPAASFPEVRQMTSSGLPGDNSPDSTEAREPSTYDMQIISVEEAEIMWGKHISTMDGHTFLFNDPDQFLQHYYHFTAELFFGAWAFWYGTFAHPEHAPLDLPAFGNTSIPIPTRAIFTHVPSSGWRDKPGFNAYFLRAALPSLSIETVDDWEDRIASTVPPHPSIPKPHYADVHSPPHEDTEPPIPYQSEERLKISGLRKGRAHFEPNTLPRAWRIPSVLLADRSAAHRGLLCGPRNQRTASESIEHMRGLGRLGPTARGWWDGIRARVVQYAGAKTEEEKGKIVITYVSRQGSRRRLVHEDHVRLVGVLEALVTRKNKEAGRRGKKWELNVMQAERMTKDEQIRAAARTTILLGVHGNGLTHLIHMPPSPLSAVIEIFYPEGFAHDYEWTSSSALGMSHYGIWNDTIPDTSKLNANYPEGFHGTSIPVHGETVASVIEQHVDTKVGKRVDVHD